MGVSLLRRAPATVAGGQHALANLHAVPWWQQRLAGNLSRPRVPLCKVERKTGRRLASAALGGQSDADEDSLKFIKSEELSDGAVMFSFGTEKEVAAQSEDHAPRAGAAAEVKRAAGHASGGEAGSSRGSPGKREPPHKADAIQEEEGSVAKEEAAAQPLAGGKPSSRKTKRRGSGKPRAQDNNAHDEGGATSAGEAAESAVKEKVKKQGKVGKGGATSQGDRATHHDREVMQPQGSVLSGKTATKAKPTSAKPPPLDAGAGSAAAHSLAKLTVPELRAKAKSANLKGYSKLRKAELIQLLEEAHC